MANPRTIKPPEKPVFIPLKAKWFEAFESGSKQEELRPYGPRWNEENCRIGRAVTLSYGYGKSRRLYGAISGFRKIKAKTIPAIKTIYPLAEDIAAIRITLSPRRGG